MKTRSIEGPVRAVTVASSDASSLFDAMNTLAVPCHRDASDTEQAAASRVSGIAAKLRRQTLAWIVEAGDFGATGKELGTRYALSIGRQPTDGSARYSIMPRATELSRLSFIEDSGRRRDGSRVWIATDAGRDAIAAAPQ